MMRSVAGRLGMVVLLAACGESSPSESTGPDASSPDGHVDDESARIVVSATAHDFGAITVGQKSPLATFSLRNAGRTPTTPLDLSLTPPGGEFTIVDDRCTGQSLSASTSCDVSVQFAPTSLGSKTASLDAGEVSIALSGRGAGDPQLHATLNTHAFEAQPVGTASSPFVWTISNPSDVIAGPVSVTIAGADATEFTQTNTCSQPIAPGGTCSVSVRFSPASLGAKTATVSATASPGAEVDLAVSGAGVWRLTVVTDGGGTVTSSDGKLSACSGTCIADYGAATNIDLVANTTNGSDAYFRGWTGTSCIGPSKSCAVSVNANVDVTARFGSYATSGNLAFVTSSTHGTNLGTSPATYDGICNGLASAAGINNSDGNLYIAWISTSNSGDGLAATRLGSTSRGWVRLDGKILGDAQSSFMNASSPAWLHPVAFDERGARIDQTPYLLTGTTPDGTAGNNCNGWSGSGSYYGGDAHGGATAWTHASNYSCTGPGRLLCLMKGRTAPLSIPSPPAGSKKIFLTNTTYAPAASTTPDSRCNGELAGAKALVSTKTKAAASLLDPATTYVRPDGIVIGTGAQILSNELESGIWQHLDGTYAVGSSLTFTPWTGASLLSDVGTDESTCNDWTSTSTPGGQPKVGDSTIVSPGASTRWWYYGSGGCFQARAFYCFEP